MCPTWRRTAADHNVIRYNELYGDDVSVAWRQFIDAAGYWRARAARNLIYGNLFDGAVLDVHDGPATPGERILPWGAPRAGRRSAVWVPGEGFALNEAVAIAQAVI